MCIVNDVTATTRARILDAARAVVRDNGVEAARLDDIADRSGVARPNIYRYFPNKQALVKEVLLAEVRHIHQQRHELLSDIGPVSDRILESLVAGAELTRSGEAVASVASPGLLEVARLIADDDDLLQLEIGYWQPLLAEARAEGRLVEGLTDERIIRWFMTCAYLVSSRPELVEDDLRAWVHDFVAPAVLRRGAP